MSLDFDYSELKDQRVMFTVETRDLPVGQREFSGVAQAIIFRCMYCGIGVITEANATEFADRIAMWSAIFGAPMSSGDEEHQKIDITAKDVRAFIGLRTNASTLTKAQFHAELIKRLRYMAEGNRRRDANQPSALEIMEILHKKHNTLPKEVMAH